MSVGTIYGYTSNYRLILINPNARGWADEMHQNLRVIDSMLYAASGLSGVSGAWENSTAYIIGDRVVDPDLGTLWQCEANHTSAASGTFAADRTANPTYWNAILNAPIYRGAWAGSTQYNANDFVSDGGRYAVCSTTHTSTTSLDADIANWDILIDGSTFNLGDFNDVTITDIASGELLKWNGSAWINNTLAEAGIAAASHTHTVSEISDADADLATFSVPANTTISSFGATLVGDADAATARQTLGVEIGVDVQAFGAYLTNITGESLADLSDVTETTPADGELLMYNSGGWINATLAEASITPIGKIAGRNAQTGTTYTAALADLGKLITMNNAGANTLTIPTNAAVAFEADRDWFAVAQYGAGTTTIQGDTGVTVNGVSAGSAAVPFRYAVIVCTKIGTNEWLVQIDGVA